MNIHLMKDYNKNKFENSIVYVYKNQLFLIAFTLFICWFFVLRYGVFGSKVDWISQHSVIPEYFRQLFYDTGELFPDFAYHIGGGQNIYNFSYYGLYSPVILFSYFLPFVKMSDYIMASSIISLAASAVLFYTWLKRRGFADEISVGVSGIFLLASPMVYHSYNHIMFVNYMPFLCMALIGVERYLEVRKWGMYLLGTFLMIMTSFYFSIGGILVLVLYGIYYYMKLHHSVSLKQFVIDGVRFVSYVFLAVMLSGVLLVPTAAALIGGRSNKPEIAVKELLIPEIKVLRFLYSPYGIGLTSLIFVVLISFLICKKCYEKILAWGILVICTVPIFGYLLNGGLYAKDKVFLPLLPILCYLIADYFKRLKEKSMGGKREIFPFLITWCLLIILRGQGELRAYWELAVIETSGMLLFFLAARRKENVHLLMVPVIGVMFIFGSVIHPKSEYILSKSFYKEVTDSGWSDIIEKIAEEDDGGYRVEQHGNVTENAANLNRIHSMGQSISSIYSSVYNEDYQRFRTDTYGLEQPFRNILMQSVSENPYFLRLMGVKYIISDERPAGYELYMEYDGKKVWINREAAPICYVTDRVMGKRQYESLTFPYNQTALSEYAVVQEGTGEAELQTEIREIELNVPSRITGKMKISLPEEVKAGQILFLQFDVKNLKPSQDVELTLEGIRNKLSAKSHVYYNDNTRFTYVVEIEEGQSSLEITHTKGDYEISHVKAYVAVDEEEGKDENEQENGEALYQNPVTLSTKETKGNRIVGDIMVAEDGYFISSIPYDVSFTVKVDGKETDYEKVNTAFLGFPIAKGQHHIVITYRAPGAAAGKVLSLAGLLSVIILICSKKIIRSRR